MKMYPFLFLSFLVWHFTACAQKENPCLDRVDYSIIDDDQDWDIDSFFLPPSQEELSSIREAWRQFNNSSKGIKVIDQYDFLQNRKVTIIEHQAEDRLHYGAVIHPQNYDENIKYPLMVWAEGLNQESPMVHVEDGYMGGFSRMLSDYFVIIPSYRGQSLNANDKVYCSDGFFGDAYDGATDDALRFLQVVLDKYAGSIDDKRLSIYGGSRGGTVALLAGIRYPKFQKVVSQSGPVQFHHRSCYDRYGFQYRYQFLNNKNTFETARRKAIRSSPLYFIDDYENQLYIVHGRKDTVVPLWNAEAVIAAKSSSDNVEHLFTDDGHGVRAARQVGDWIKKNN